MHVCHAYYTTIYTNTLDQDYNQLEQECKSVTNYEFIVYNNYHQELTKFETA